MSRFPVLSTHIPPTTLNRVISTGCMSLNPVFPASCVMALNTLGARTMMHNLSHIKVPKIVLITSMTTLYLYVSLGKGASWMVSLSCGMSSQEATTTPPIHAKTERNKGWFSSIPIVYVGVYVYMRIYMYVYIVFIEVFIIF